MLGAVVRLLTTVIGETVRQSIDTAIERLEQAHVRERDALAERFEAALRSQDARLHEVLEHQARQHTEDLRVILDLLAAVPTRPRPAEYAAVVLEASLRRQVACHGVLLQAAALAAALDRSSTRCRIRSTTRNAQAPVGPSNRNQKMTPNMRLLACV